jgi:hypothetical protein
LAAVEDEEVLAGEAVEEPATAPFVLVALESGACERLASASLTAAQRSGVAGMWPGPGPPNPAPPEDDQALP